MGIRKVSAAELPFMNSYLRVIVKWFQIAIGVLKCSFGILDHSVRYALACQCPFISCCLALFHDLKVSAELPAVLISFKKKLVGYMDRYQEIGWYTRLSL